MNDVGLNLFQRIVRTWDAVHPYNAAQVVRVEGRIDPAAATDTWAAALRGMGLGRVRVTEKSFRHEILNGEMERFPVRKVPAHLTLEDVLSEELNRPFDDPDEPPFRPFMLQEDGSYWFGVAYQHWVADSVSVRMLLGEWFARQYDPSALRGRAARMSREGYWELFGARAGKFRLEERALALFRSHMRHRWVRKVRTLGPKDYPVRVALYPRAATAVAPLLAYAREHGAKVHDVLLAAVAEACDRFVPLQSRGKRRDLAVGSIVDLRRQAPADLHNTFGLFLGFSDIVCRPHDLKAWDRLVRCVAAQNRAHKARGVPQASLLWMAAALAVSPLVSSKELYKFYRKELPMAGGLSNVNLNESWAVRYYPSPLLDYVRVSPTGPLVPLVFSTSTLGERLTFAMTYRDALLGPDVANEMGMQFARRLTSLASPRCDNAAPQPIP